MATATAEPKKTHVDPFAKMEAQDRRQKDKVTEAYRLVVAAMAIDEEPDAKELRIAREGSDCRDDFRYQLAQDVEKKKRRYRDAKTMANGAGYERQAAEASADIERIQKELIKHQQTARKEVRRLDILRRWLNNQHFAGMLAEARLGDGCNDPEVLTAERKLIDEKMALHEQIREIEKSLKPQSIGNAGNTAWRIGQIEKLLAEEGTANKCDLERELKGLRKTTAAEQEKTIPLKKRSDEINVELQKFSPLKLIP